jgi:16S rRNA pseudouridine516 synthase
MQRLDKILGHMGVGTRSEIKLLVKRGEVLLNGAQVKDSGVKVNVETAEITVSGERIVYREFVYLMMNKPAGVISATEDRRLKTVLDLLPKQYAHYELFPVGRLDRDTEGLLLLTNDGKLAHDLLSPRKHVQKTYYAVVQGIVDEHDVAAFSAGVILDDGYETLPAILHIDYVDATTRQSKIRLTITEGKFHQVKRMFIARGKQVVFLKRLAMGSLVLDEHLPLGAVRELTEVEWKGLRRSDE